MWIKRFHAEADNLILQVIWQSGERNVGMANRNGFKGTDTVLGCLAASCRGVALFRRSYTAQR